MSEKKKRQGVEKGVEAASQKKAERLLQKGTVCSKSRAFFPALLLQRTREGAWRIAKVGAESKRAWGRERACRQAEEDREERREHLFSSDPRPEKKKKRRPSPLSRASNCVSRVYLSLRISMIRRGPSIEVRGGSNEGREVVPRGRENTKRKTFARKITQRLCCFCNEQLIPRSPLPARGGAWTLRELAYACVPNVGCLTLPEVARATVVVARVVMTRAIVFGVGRG